MKITHTVIKNADLDLLPKSVREALNSVCIEIGEVRKMAGKEVNPQYLIVNADEPWAHEVAAVIAKRTGGVK